MRTIVFNGWAAGPEVWDLTSFHRDWTFDYVEQMDGVPERVLADFDEFVLVGFSMGSTMALKMLLKFPERVRGLVLVSATPRMMSDVDWPGFTERRIAAFLQGTQMIYAGNPSPMYRTDNLERGLDFLRNTDLRRELEERFAGKEVGFPVEVLHSERDGIVRPNNALYFKSLFPQAKVTMVPGNEHVLPIHAHDLVNKAVDRVSNFMI